MFKTHEPAAPGTQVATSDLIAALKFDANGLIPAVAQQHDTREILMMAWMNRDALQETLKTRRVCYFSRSRGKLWRKGESSGQIQKLHALYADCDGDTLVVEVDQTGPACHTGRSSCFYWRIDETTAEITSAPLIDPATLYGRADGASSPKDQSADAADSIPTS
ncbi:MAG: phosphoribosyl-AMP cyclohydrolase [Thioalkalivibrionaceae bacterium]